MRAWFFAVVLLGACATAGPPDGDILRQMRALEAERGAAIRADDEAALSRIYVEDFQGVTTTGVTRHARAALRRVCAHTRASARVGPCSGSEVLTAKREGSTAVVTGRLHFGASDGMYTHVFRRRGDHWELFAAAASPIAGS